MAMDNFIPNEKTVTIPIGMDCRELKYRMKDGKPGGIVLCQPYEIEHLSRDADNE